MNTFLFLMLTLYLFSGISYSYTDFCEISPKILYSGRTFSVLCQGTNVQVLWLEKTHALMPRGDNESMGYFGIPLSLDASKPSTQNIKISSQGKTWLQKIVIRPHAYPVEVIKLKPQKQGLVAPEKLNNESNIIGEFFKTFSNEKLWTQNFLMPAKGRISSDFGFRRDYFVEKKRVSQWQHRGVDITAPIGTEIVAPANGRVILSENFESHGGTLMIDHGWGVVSIFNHLKTRLVNTGDMVNAGEKIASMGDSGIATGSNVHWGLSVNGVRVDPVQWTTPSPFGHSP